METVLISGGTGLVGTALSNVLVKEGYRVVILSRRQIDSGKATIQYAQWDPNKGQLDRHILSEADYIIHLAGESVAEGRWTEKRKKEIRDSRVKSGELLTKSLQEIPTKIKAFISASAIGWYGTDTQPAKPFLETDLPANDFLGSTCRAWEASVSENLPDGIRLVILRTGIVLSNEGGAYPSFKKPLQFGVAPVLGEGNQVVSWIHIDDLVKIYVSAIKNNHWKGIYNAVAPHPVSNKEMMREIAKGKKHISMKTPAIMLKLALGEMSIEVLKSTTVSSQKLQQQGFHFQFPHLASAVDDLKKKASEKEA